MSNELGKDSRPIINGLEPGIPVPEAQKKKYQESLEKSPILVEKVLEFLYTGDYTFERRETKSVDRQTDDQEMPELDLEPLGDTIDFIPEERLVDEPVKAIEDASNETDAPATETEAIDKTPATKENVEDELVDGSPIEESPSPMDEAPGQDPIEQGDAGELAVNILTDCHSSYFHMRMYGEGGYFKISDLRTKAKANFCASFMNCPEGESFAKIIEKIYSTQGNYWRLKTPAIDMIMDSLPNLWKETTPVIDKKLLNSVPDFGYDLWQATVKKYAAPASTPSSVASEEDIHVSEHPWRRSLRNLLILV
ncbi:hypothetical protein N7517_001177 [Penicillium concentricum]|uniref:BTB domain-containing protein n=1 Tax=Penicillium concentricum TaxID=293559 RepID=A0A9W9SRC3_9EURO|nr:uncharacterized protein N7517_001177 [Penicillium concentricum]KAJ5383266.1 hypothetical protein N7517_001177 [Penicillium concentricum]